MRFFSVLISATLFLSLGILIFHAVGDTYFGKIVAFLNSYAWSHRFILLFRILWALALGGAAYHEIHNWQKSKHQLYFVDSVEALLAKLDELTGDEERRPQDKLDEFLRVTLQLSRTSFREKNAVQANFAKLKDSELRIVAIDPPDAGYDPKFVLRLGEGGSGYAVQNRATVYFPWIWIRHAVHVGFDRAKLPARLKSAGVCLDLYRPAEKRYTVYSSVLSTTVAWEASTPYGVLSFDSDRRDAFSEVDFKIAAVYAQILGLAFKRLSPPVSQRRHDQRRR